MFTAGSILWHHFGILESRRLWNFFAPNLEKFASDSLTYISTHHIHYILNYKYIPRFTMATPSNSASSQKSTVCPKCGSLKNWFSIDYFTYCSMSTIDLCCHFRSTSRTKLLKSLKFAVIKRKNDCTKFLFDAIHIFHMICYLTHKIQS